MRLIGPLGMILSVLGTALVSGVVLVEIAGAGGTAVENVLAGSIAGMLATLAGLGFFVGWLLFALGTMRARAFPRGAGLLLMVGDLVFGSCRSAPRPQRTARRNNAPAPCPHTSSHVPTAAIGADGA